MKVEEIVELPVFFGCCPYRLQGFCVRMRIVSAFVQQTLINVIPIYICPDPEVVQLFGEMLSYQ